MDISGKLSAKLKDLSDNSGGKVQIDNFEAVVNDFVLLFKECLQENDSRLYREIQGIGNKIQETKDSISKSLPDGVVADATMELDAVIKSTEEATNKILDASEHIQELVRECSDKELSDKIVTDISVIFEACNFQDLTGQRIQKVTSALEFIEKSVGGMLAGNVVAEIKTDNRKDAHLMNGPQAIDNQPDQDDVDKLFDSV